MKLFTARLNETQRAKLELIRADLGCRSDADAVRALIDQFRLSPPRAQAIPELVRVRAATTERIEREFGPRRAAAGSRLKK